MEGSLGLVNHLTRRQATYVWRRRLPVEAGSGSVQVSLRTANAREARQIGAVVTLASESLFSDMTDDRLTRDEAKALLDGIVRDELDKLARHRAVRLTNGFNDEVDQRREDTAAGLALRLLAEGGFGVSLTGAHLAGLRSEGFDDALINQTGRVLEVQRNVEQLDAPPAPTPEPTYDPDLVALARSLAERKQRRVGRNAPGP